MDYKKISQEILANIGGKENIENAAHCVTRLRLVLKDTSKFDKEALSKIEGTKGVFLNSGQLQIIFGTGTVEKVFAAFLVEAGLKEASLSDVKSAGMKKENIFKQGFKVFSDIFIPIIPAFVGAALILGIKSVITTAGLFGMEGSLADKYEVIAGFAAFLTVVASTFAFLPLLVTYSAVKRFGGNPIFGIVLGCTMLYPTLMDANVFALGKETPEYWNLFGISVPAVGFQGSVSIIAQGGGAIGMYLLAKKRSKDREVAVSSFIPTLFGISEPAIFAVNLKDSSIPFLCSIFGAGLAGAYMKIFDVKAIGFALTGLPGLTIVNPPALPHYIIGNLLAFSLPIVFIILANRVKKFK